MENTIDKKNKIYSDDEDKINYASNNDLNEKFLNSEPKHDNNEMEELKNWESEKTPLEKSNIKDYVKQNFFKQMIPFSKVI